MVIKKSVQLTEQTQGDLWPPDVTRVLTVKFFKDRRTDIHHLGTDRCSLATFEHSVIHP